MFTWRFPPHPEGGTSSMRRLSTRLALVVISFATREAAAQQPAPAKPPAHPVLQNSFSLRGR